MALKPDTGKEIARMALSAAVSERAMLEGVVRYCMDQLGHHMTDAEFESLLGDLFCEAGLNGRAA